jgi:hypothetical protein
LQILKINSNRFVFQNIYISHCSTSTLSGLNKVASRKVHKQQVCKGKIDNQIFGRSTEVDQSPRHFKVEGSSPDFLTVGRKGEYWGRLS